MTTMERIFARAVYTCQFFFGGWFLFHGLNYWFAFYDDPSILPGPGLIPALVATGLMAVIKALEIVIGLALLADFFAPLAIVAAWPIALIIAYVNASGFSPFGIVVAAITIGLNAAMSFGHLDRYRPMLAANAGPPSLDGLRGRSGGCTRRLPPARNLLGAVAGVAAAALLTFWSLTL